MDGQEKLLDYLGREVRRLPAKHSFVWDVIYIVELKKVGKREKARTAGSHSVRHFARFCASLLVFCAFTVRRDFPRWLTTI